MKTEQEQIDRIAKDIIYSVEDCHGNHCATCYMRERCTVKYHARKVYNTGYRKATEVIDEFVERLKSKALTNCKIVNCYEIKFIETKIDDIAVEMRQEVEK